MNATQAESLEVNNRVRWNGTLGTVKDINRNKNIAIEWDDEPNKLWVYNWIFDWNGTALKELQYIEIV